MPILRFATENDNTQLNELASSSTMNGETALRIDRKPNFFSLLRMRGESKVLVAVENNRIVGSVSVSRQYSYIGGKIYPVYYVADFKVSPELRRKGIGLKLCDELGRYVISVNGDLVFLTVAWGNTMPLPFFSNRKGVPDFENIGKFTVYQFIGRKISRSIFPIDHSPVNTELIHYLDRHYRNYQLGAVITPEKLAGNTLYVIRKNQKIVAAMCIADTMNVKQNVVIRMKWQMRILLKVMSILKPFLKISAMPEINQPVKMMYIKYLIAENNDAGLVKAMIDYARNLAYEKNYSFVSIGVHERDMLNNSLPSDLRLKFHSMGMLLSLKNSQQIVKTVKDGMPFEDYSLV